MKVVLIVWFMTMNGDVTSQKIEFPSAGGYAIDTMKTCEAAGERIVLHHSGSPQYAKYDCVLVPFAGQ